MYFTMSGFQIKNGFRFILKCGTPVYVENETKR